MIRYEGTLKRGQLCEGMAMTSVAGGYGYIGLCCPVCDCAFVHLEEANCPTPEGDGYGSIFSGECGHRWAIEFNPHKGAMFVNTRRLPDGVNGYSDDLEPTIEALNPAPMPTPRSALPKMLRWYIVEKFDYICQYCKRQHRSSKAGPDGKPWHIDHMVALSLGGVDGPENLTLSCERCNLRKHAKRPRDFRP